ncbi:MAG TPA: hypothetical protein PLG20_00650 [Candidatus Syntrophosphaera sp.]|nr:hypothetical protein [Candidatus Syntrophosphaera sp.]
MIKRSFVYLCLLLLACVGHALVIQLEDGSSIVGQINAKDNATYSVDTDYGNLNVPIGNVKRILDGDKDVTVDFYRKAGFSNTITKYDIKNLDSYVVRDLTLYEREMLSQFEKLNQNTARISNTMWTIWGVSAGVAILAIILSSGN